MNPLALYAAIALIATTLGGAGAWRVQSWRYEARDKARIEAQIELDRNNRKVAQSASEGFENDRAKTTTQYRTIEVEVEKIVERPIYRDHACFDDDGMRALRSAIGATGNTGQPENAVPATAKPQ